jgi:hypothetical protein
MCFGDSSCVCALEPLQKEGKTVYAVARKEIGLSKSYPTLNVRY